MDIEDCVRTETIMGKPLVVDNLTLIPLIEIDLVLSTIGKDKKGSRLGFSAVGIGAKIAPTSILVIKGEEIYMLSLSQKDIVQEQDITIK